MQHSSGTNIPESVQHGTSNFKALMPNDVTTFVNIRGIYVGGTGDITAADPCALRLCSRRSLMEQTDGEIDFGIGQYGCPLRNSFATTIEKMRAVRSSATLIFPSPLNLRAKSGICSWN